MFWLVDWYGEMGFAEKIVIKAKPEEKMSDVLHRFAKLKNIELLNTEVDAPNEYISAQYKRPSDDEEDGPSEMTIEKIAEYID